MAYLDEHGLATFKGKIDEPRCNSGINGVTSKPAQFQRCGAVTLTTARSAGRR